MSEQQIENIPESKILADRMRKGSGVSSLLQAEGSTHYVDSLQRFRKDYASYDRAKREEEKARKQMEIEKKRLEYLERENRRWEMAEQKFVRKQESELNKIQEQALGIRKTANSNSLAYNPINLSYDRNQQGEKLKHRDEDTKIRGYVRAHNMDYRGNSKYNPLNGGDRVGIESVIPTELTGRYSQKLREHYDSLKVQVPSTANSDRQNPRIYY